MIDYTPNLMPKKRSRAFELANLIIQQAIIQNKMLNLRNEDLFYRGGVPKSSIPAVLNINAISNKGITISDRPKSWGDNQFAHTSFNPLTGINTIKDLDGRVIETIKMESTNNSSIEFKND